MKVKELIEKLKLAPEDATVERGDSNKVGNPITTDIYKIEIELGEDYQSVTIW